MKLITSIVALASATVILVSACGVIPTSTTGSTGSTTGSGGMGGHDGTAITSSSASTGTGFTCSLCNHALGNSLPTSALCAESAVKYEALVKCVCVDTCAPVCVMTVAGDGGMVSTCGLSDVNPSLACKVCMGNLMGCGAERDACQQDDGTAPMGSTTAGSTSTGAACACPANMPLCPGGSWACSTPGDVTHGPSCGSASYCSPCCDSTDSCKIHGSCAVTKISNVTCVEGYECCSGVCTAGKCVGGCGVILPGSGAGSSTGTGG